MISVIIPCYNSEKFLVKCFESLKNQTYTNYELIFINDGSKDKTLEVLEQLKVSNPDMAIEVINQKNLGVSSTRNRGIELAKGEYISFIDADDYIYPEFFETLIKGFEEDVDISVVGVEKSNELVKEDEYNDYILNNTEYFHNLFTKKDIMGYPVNKLYKTNIIKNNNLKFDTELFLWEDLEFNVKYSKYINRAYVINKKLYHYVIHEKGANSQPFTEKTLNILKSLDKMYDFSYDNLEKRELIVLSKCRASIDLLRKIYKNNLEEIYKYEEKLLLKILRKNNNTFIKKGLQMGKKFYILNIIFSVSPKLMKMVLKYY